MQLLVNRRTLRIVMDDSTVIRIAQARLANYLQSMLRALLQLPFDLLWQVGSQLCPHGSDSWAVAEPLSRQVTLFDSYLL